MKLETLREGTEIYNGGDRMNPEKFGHIIAVHMNKWGTFYDIQYDDGSVSSSISHSNFSAEYHGTSMTRFVTKSAYRVYREKMMAIIEERRDALTSRK